MLCCDTTPAYIKVNNNHNHSMDERGEINENENKKGKEEIKGESIEKELRGEES